jgi:hypothetical protein
MLRLNRHQRPSFTPPLATGPDHLNLALLLLYFGHKGIGGLQAASGGTASSTTYLYRGPLCCFLLKKQSLPENTQVIYVAQFIHDDAPVLKISFRLPVTSFRLKTSEQ